MLTDEDVHLFNEGTHDRAYLKLGSHPATREGEDGTAFAVWAPGAARVSVVGEFNGWKADRHPLRLRQSLLRTLLRRKRLRLPLRLQLARGRASR